MKTIRFTPFIALVWLVWGSTFPPPRVQAAPPETETNATFVQIKQASNDVQRLAAVLPAVEKLWPDQPVTYVECVKATAAALRGRTNDPVAKATMLNLWTNLFQKPLPADEEQAIGVLELKWQAICAFWSVREYSDDKARWLDIAGYIGEIRPRIITNYMNQTFNYSGPAMALSPEEWKICPRRWTATGSPICGNSDCVFRTGCFSTNYSSIRSF